MVQDDVPQPSDEATHTQYLLSAPTAVADVYADSFSVALSPYTVSLSFGLQFAQGTSKGQAIVRMSPQHAKMMCILFARQLKQYEREFGEIVLPERLLISKEVDLTRDWNAV